MYGAKNEKVRQGWLRTLGYLAGQYHQLKRDEDLEEMRAEIKELKAQQVAEDGPAGVPRT